MVSAFLKNILTQSSRLRTEGRRGEWVVITKFSDFYMSILIFITKINMKKESGFLIAHIPLRPLRLCVKNFK
jgi:hypothetical protein